MKKLVIFLFPLFIISFFLPQLINAQTLGLGIYPPLLEVTIMPGKTITQVYKLNNAGEVDLMMTSQMVAFRPSDQTGGTKLLLEKSLEPIVFSFLNADLRLGQTFSLPAGETQEIVLKIKVPETSQEKDYYAVLLFQTAPMKSFGQFSTSQTQAKIGSPLLISVSRTGEPFKKAAVVEFSTPKLIDSFSQVNFNLQIKNIGHSFFKPAGKISLQGWLRQEENLDLLPQNILSDYSREIQCQIEDEITPCQTQTKFLIGPFKAKLEFGLDNFSGEYQQEIHFIALPFKLIFALIALTVILWLIKTKLKLDNQ